MTHDDGYRTGSVERRFQLLSELDEHFAHLWLDHVTALFERDGLDRRSRYLVLVGQYTMIGDTGALGDTITGAVEDGIDPRELLEALLQCYVYGGESTVIPAAQVFKETAERLGILDDVQQRQLRRDQVESARDLEAEQAAWRDEDVADPRLRPLLERYGRLGISKGLQLRPGHHLNAVASLDGLDTDFTATWLRTIYAGMYARDALDVRTRLLCVVGDCLVVGEQHQAPRHMRGALRQGASAAQLLDVIFQTCAIAGHAKVLPSAVDDLVLIFEDLQRLDELIAPEHQPAAMEVVRARVRTRAGTQEVTFNARGQ